VGRIYSTLYYKGRLTQEENSRGKVGGVLGRKKAERRRKR
jgi:hypothetical protein